MEYQNVHLEMVIQIMDTELNTHYFLKLISPFHFAKHFPNPISHFTFRKCLRNQINTSFHFTNTFII